jgi:hypothetical protein
MEERRNADLMKQRNPYAPPRAIRLVIIAAPDEGVSLWLGFSPKDVTIIKLRRRILPRDNLNERN